MAAPGCHPRAMSKRHAVSSRCAVGLALLLATELRVLAATFSFDFDTGPGTSFATFNSGNLFALGLSGPDFRISKPADDGSFLPSGFVSGGIVSKFSVTGNFRVTVDFTLPSFPLAAPGSTPLNESILGVSGSNGELFLVLRFRNASGDKIEAYGGAGGPTGAQDSSLTSGRYQIERVGDTVTGRFAPAGSDTFMTLGSFSGYSAPQFKIQLSGTQGTEGGSRSTTALDVAFDNLIVEADGLAGGESLLNISTRLRVL